MFHTFLTLSCCPRLSCFIWPPPSPCVTPPPPLRYAQELLREAGVSLVLNLKPELLERLARCLGTKVCVALWRGGALG